MKQKLITFFLALVVSVGTISAQSGTCGDNLTWTLQDSTLTISGTGAMNDYDQHYNLPWYSYLTFIKTVIIGNGVTSIGDRAFYECSGLTSVTIPNGITSIGEAAFYSCRNLTSVAIPNSVTTIRKWAFGYSGLTSIEIPDSVTIIRSCTFYCSNLTSITIPNSCKSVEVHAFYNCRVNTVNYKGSLVDWLNKAWSPAGHFWGYQLQLNGVLQENIIIPNSVTSIKDEAFAYCSGLTSVIIPNSVTNIGRWAFAYCSGLTSITIEAETPQTLGDYSTFDTGNDCPIYVPCGTLDAYKSAWSEFASRIKYVALAFIVTGKAKEGSSGEVMVPLTICDDTLVTAIPYYGYHFIQWSDGNADNPRKFALTQDTTFTAEFALDTYGQCGNNLYWKYEDGKLAITGSGDMYQYTQSTIPWALWKLEIKSVSCSSGMTSLSDYAFSGINTSKFNTIILPANLVSIGAHAFDGDSFLETIDFGANLEYIGNYAFRGCVRVLNMTIWSEFTPNVGYYALDDISNYAELSVLSTALKKYQVDPNWSRFLLKELGATQTTTTGDVIVEPGDNTAVFTWPTDSKAASYTIEITKDGVVFCTLIFNENGQLTGIAFAPSKDGQGNAPAATLTSSGMQFTVTGLDAATNYAFSLTTKGNNGNILASYSGTFGTTGAPVAIENVSANLDGSRKLLRNGQLLILRGDKTYMVIGQEVK